MSSNTKPIGSPFIIGNMITEPTKFHGRRRECEEILSRLRKMESTSIVGPRRIGKSSVAYFIYKVGVGELGEDYEFVWMDGQSNHSTSVRHFCNAIARASSLIYEPGQDLSSCLINLEDAIKGHPKKLILIINEFEMLTDPTREVEFGIPFYNTLRFLAEQGFCALITTSYIPLKELCKHILGVTSPFYNIFEQVMLQHFTTDEADSFLVQAHDGVNFSADEVGFIQKRVKAYQHPLVLQVAADAVFKNRYQGCLEQALSSQIEARLTNYLTHEQVQEGRRVKKEEIANRNTPQRIGKPLDMLISIVIPVLGIGLLMLTYGLLIQWLTNSQAVLVALVTAILGFGVLVFAGRSVDIIAESTFFKLFLKLMDQIPLLSNLADNILRIADRVKKE